MSKCMCLPLWDRDPKNRNARTPAAFSKNYKIVRIFLQFTMGMAPQEEKQAKLLMTIYRQSLRRVRIKANFKNLNLKKTSKLFWQRYSKTLKKS